MSLSLASPDWPADNPRGEHLRRYGLPYFLLLSLLAHGLALLFKVDSARLFTTPGSETRLSIALLRERLPSAPPPFPAAPRASADSPRARTTIGGNGSPKPGDPAAAPEPANFQMRQSSADIDATDLVERSKAELMAASRRQMIDPMFAPPARHAPGATPVERTTALAGMKIEERGPDVIRVTNADGSRYCLQRLPEIATRDIPVAVVGVPMKCQ